MPAPSPVQLEVLVRAEKRLTSHIARRGIDAQAVAICATYEHMYDATLTGDLTIREVDDLAALVDVVSPVLLANARAERARRTVVNR